MSELKLYLIFLNWFFFFIILENQTHKRYDVLKYVKDETSQLIPQNHPDRMESITEGMKLITSSRIRNVHIRARTKGFKV